MFRQKIGYRAIIAGLLPIDFNNYDKVSKDIQTAKDFEKENFKSETGLERLKLMFTVDEFGSISSELNSIYQAGFLGFFIGAIYGGFIKSRVAYINFMENNQATAFKSHLDAKKKLQDEVTLSFAKGGFKWGWRVALFTTSYTAIITCISVYREKSSIYEYMAAGGVTGAAYKMSLGLRGIAVGGGLGLVLGSIAGAFSLGLMKLSGTSMEEVRYWQYKWQLKRDQDVKEAIKAQSESEPSIIQEHEKKFAKQNPSLDNI